MRRLDALRDLVTRHIDEAQVKQVRIYNRGKRDVRFQICDRVLYKAHWLSCAADKFNAKRKRTCRNLSALSHRGEMRKSCPIRVAPVCVW